MPCGKVFGHIRKFLVDQHLSTGKHFEQSIRWTQSKLHQQDVAQMLRSKLETSEISGSKLPIETSVFRYRIVDMFLKLKIPLSKLDGEFRQYLEFVSTTPLTDRRHLSSIITLIRDHERSLVKEKLSFVTVVSDLSSMVRPVWENVWESYSEWYHMTCTCTNYWFACK